MSTVVEAVYENGILKPAMPLALPEGTRVRVTITPADENDDPLAGVIGVCEGPPDGAENHDKYIYGNIRP
jgi:predicted DNA-binding antitoxin AbrB/MazE fold protein